MALIGTVVAVTGAAYLITGAGVRRELQLGDQIQTGDTIETPRGVEVELQLTNGRLIHIYSEQTVQFTEELSEAIAPSNVDSAVNLATIETVIKAIEEGKDINVVLEETAAGQAGLYSSYGFNFVDLFRINDILNAFNFAYNYEVSPRIDTDPLADGDDITYLGLQDTRTPGSPINNAPTALAAIASGAEDSASIAITLSGSDADGTIASITLNSLPANGSLYSDALLTTPVVAGTAYSGSTAMFYFAPNSNFNGNTNFSFTVTDDMGRTATTPATATITVTSDNDNPQANLDNVTTFAETPITLTPLTNDTDVDGDSLSVSIIGGTTVTPGIAQTITIANGTIDITAGGAITFIPDTGFSGAVAINYTVDDGNGGTDTATINVNVTPNTPPQGADASRTFNEDTSYTLVANDFGFSDADVGQTLTAVRIDSLPVNGTLMLNGNPVAAGNVISVAAINANQLIFTPAANANGNNYANFTFSVQDDIGGFDPAPNTLSFNVTSINDAPSISVTANAFTEDGAGTVANAVAASYSISDIDLGDSLTVSFTGASNAAGYYSLDTINSQVLLSATGTAWVNAGNLLPAVSLTVTDNGTPNLSASASDTPIVTVVNDAPQGADNTITLNEDGSHSFVAADFGFSDGNDSPANALAAVIISSLPAVGSLTLAGIAVSAGQSIAAADIGNLLYTPVANANGNNYASFTFQVQDDGGTANGGIDTDQSANSISFNVTSINDAPSISVTA
ncbi:MAG: retention module-containing protein, partial [Pseudomonadota bacterium]